MEYPKLSESDKRAIFQAQWDAVIAQLDEADRALRSAIEGFVEAVKASGSTASG